MVKPLTHEDTRFVRSLILFEDAHVLVLNKPAGLSSQGGRIAVNTLDDLLWAFAKSNGKRPRLVHRLDRDTSGVILTAKTQPAAAFLGKAMMARRMKKTYLAIVAPGAPTPANGRIETPLRRHLQGPEAYVRTCEADHPDAQVASTGYRTLSATAEAAVSRRIRMIAWVGTRLSSTVSGSSKSWTAVSGADRATAKWSRSQVDSLPLGPITKTVVANRSDGLSVLMRSRVMPSANSWSRSSCERCVRQPISSTCCMLCLPF